MIRNPWTIEEDEFLSSLVEKGLSRTDICNSFPFHPPNSVDNRLYKLNLTTRDSRNEDIIELVNLGMKAGEIAKKLSLDKQFVYNKLYLMKLKNDVKFKNYWNKADIKQLRNLIHRGYTLQEIYEVFPNRTPKNINTRITVLKLSGIQKKGEELRSSIIELTNKGFNPTQIANELKVDVQTVTNKLYLFKQKQQNTVKNKPWTPEEMVKLKTLVNKKTPYVEIAKKLGRSETAACNKVSRMKISVSGKAWSTTEDEKLQTMTRQNKSVAQISKALGRTPKAVVVRRTVLNKRFVNHILEPTPVKVEQTVSLLGSNSDNMKIIQQILDSGKKAIIIL